MCFWYHSSKKAARKEEKIDYLDNKLKMFKNIEFIVSAISLAALVACVFCPVLPEFGLVTLGVNFLVCFVGSLAFHMKHEKESDNIKKAKEAVNTIIHHLLTFKILMLGILFRVLLLMGISTFLFINFIMLVQ
ncbi:putative membrane protein [Wolbachia endosymbiont of Wuchereria bancrofti]|nr:putative membrane protein [Wolbachia endosymbiont of Wuchereria bancrofti]